MPPNYLSHSSAQPSIPSVKKEKGLREREAIIHVMWEILYLLEATRVKRAMSKHARACRLCKLPALLTFGWEETVQCYSQRGTWRQIKAYLSQIRVLLPQDIGAVDPRVLPSQQLKHHRATQTHTHTHPPLLWWDEGENQAWPVSSSPWTVLPPPPVLPP